jgi:hypothetical protein
MTDGVNFGVLAPLLMNKKQQGQPQQGQLGQMGGGMSSPPGIGALGQMYNTEKQQQFAAGTAGPDSRAYALQQNMGPDGMRASDLDPRLRMPTSGIFNTLTNLAPGQVGGATIAPTSQVQRDDAARGIAPFTGNGGTAAVGVSPSVFGNCTTCNGSGAPMSDADTIKRADIAAGVAPDPAKFNATPSGSFDQPTPDFGDLMNMGDPAQNGNGASSFLGSVGMGLQGALSGIGQLAGAIGGLF